MKNQLIEIVREFREAFQLKQNNLKLHHDLFNEEFRELFDSKTNEDYVDALADMVFVSCGAIIDGFTQFFDGLHYTIALANRGQLDLIRATQTVFTSNMSKLATLDSITSTRDKYAKIGVEVEFQAVDDCDHTAGFRVVCSKTVIGTDGKEYPEGKLLKSTDYKSPDWSYLEGVA